MLANVVLIHTRQRGRSKQYYIGKNSTNILLQVDNILVAVSSTAKKPLLVTVKTRLANAPVKLFLAPFSLGHSLLFQNLVSQTIQGGEATSDSKKFEARHPGHCHIGKSMLFLVSSQIGNHLVIKRLPLRFPYSPGPSQLHWHASSHEYTL